MGEYYVRFDETISIVHGNFDPRRYFYCFFCGIEDDALPKVLC